MLVRSTRFPYVGCCGLRLIVELTPESAATLSAGAILGMRYHHGRITHARYVQCLRRQGECHCTPALDGFSRITANAGMFRGLARTQQGYGLRCLSVPKFQDNLVDRHGQVPGIYQPNRVVRKRLLSWLKGGQDFLDLQAPQIAANRIEDTQHGAEHSDSECYPLNPTHSSHSPLEGPSVDTRDH